MTPALAFAFLAPCAAPPTHPPSPHDPSRVPFPQAQLAASFFHYDEIEIFDLKTITPNADAKPVLTLISGGVSAAGGGGGGGGRVGAAAPGRLGSFRSGSGGGGVSIARRASGGSGGLGHLSFEFVWKKTFGTAGLHVVAGGRGGAIRVWRLAPCSARQAKQVAPYLQVRQWTQETQVSSSSLCVAEFLKVYFGRVNL